jgi:Peptidase_C39 like family
VSSPEETSQRHVALRTWRSGQDFCGGTHQGTSVTGGQLSFECPAGTLRYADPYGDEPTVARGYEWAAWVSPAVEPPFRATSLIPSWNASTPGGSWVAVEARTRSGERWSRWLTLARWADSDREIHPTSVPGQSDDAAVVNTDVLDAPPDVDWTSYQLRVVLLRPHGSADVPTIRLVAAMASRVPAEAPEKVSNGGAAWGIELPVPAYSQQLHRGQFAHWDSGGSSWCSPTSTSMLLAFHDRLPAPADHAWVDPAHPNGFVVHGVRRVFDYAYEGAGNWAFNTAYAGRPGVTAFVTRLRSLEEAELFVAAGIPLAATVAFPEDGLRGAGYATEGHLLTIVGFTSDGDVISNDPASHSLPSNDEVRAVYDRAEFERVWLGSTGGVVYVVHPDDVPLPPVPDPAEPNW